MIIGIGTDIIEISRVRQAVGREIFKQKVFSAAEQNYCESRGKQKYSSYAARFAAKEAFFKALGTGIFSRPADVEIVNDERGRPEIFLHGKVAAQAKLLGVEKISVSLSHSHNFATAVCIVE